MSHADLVSPTGSKFPPTDAARAQVAALRRARSPSEYPLPATPNPTARQLFDPTQNQNASQGIPPTARAPSNTTTMTPRQIQAQNEEEITGAAAAAAAAISQLEAKLETLTLELEQERSRNRTENTAAAAEQTDAEHAQQHTPRQPKNESQYRNGNEPIQATQSGAPHPDHNSEGEKRSGNDNENESKSEKGNANGNENARVMRSGQDAQPVKPSQITMRRDQAKSPATDLSFLRQSRIGTERCEMDSAFEILTAAYNLEEPLRCLKDRSASSHNSVLSETVCVAHNVRLTPRFLRTGHRPDGQDLGVRVTGSEVQPSKNNRSSELETSDSAAPAHFPR